jgi:RNA polymerase sigma-70 factor (ECF subfamily)
LVGLCDVLLLAQRRQLWEARSVAGEQLSDETLVYAIARGDRSAFAHLYDRQSPLLLALGARILRDSREAEDVLHDVFVEVWKHAGDFDPSRASARTWLCLRMRSRCLDRVRVALRCRAHPLEDAVLDPLPETQSAGSDAQRVRAALAALPEPQRQVLVLGYFQGLSSQEIADALHIPLGTVKSRVAAALSHLRSALGENELEGAAS